DVLSFSYLDEQFGDEIGGEIYIAIKRAKEQAVSLDHSLTRELAFLFSHGLLHIYGYEHSKKRQTSILEKLQDKILVMASVSPE
ncbi:MAG: rRNA maturation RNase YbeY, partial [Candidatus Gracilibacteria bacterium]|nr:rRNA maturation RNase YbeY [Candidatus Gracilibacteria bacterium]